MKTLKHLAALCAALFLTAAAFGQTARMHLNGTLQNMHLWRGQQVADGGANFYGYDGIDQISLRATYKLKLGRFDMPVFAHAMWNPDQRAGYLQVGVNLFAF